MKGGAVAANSGHFNVEIDIEAMASEATKRPVRTFVDEYRFTDSHRVFLLAEGRLINLSAADRHPAVTDVSFTNPALCAEFMAQNAATLERKLYDVPVETDREIARLKLRSLGMKIDELTTERRSYLESWEMGT